MAKKRNSALVGVGLIVGLLVVLQIRSYSDVAALVTRDATPADTFQQIYALKMANESLKEEILALEGQRAQYSDQSSTYDAIVAEIEKNELLLGLKPIVGSGVILSVDASLPLEWLVDLTNELWAAGAEAVAINGIRLTSQSDGFYELNTWVLLDGKIMEGPLTFEVIGDASVMTTLLSQSGGILGRLQQDFPSAKLGIQTSNSIEMDALESLAQL